MKVSMKVSMKEIKESLVKSIIGSAIDVALYETPFNNIIKKSCYPKWRNGETSNAVFELSNNLYIEMKFKGNDGEKLAGKNLFSANFKFHISSIGTGFFNGHNGLIGSKELNDILGDTFTSACGHKLTLLPQDINSGWYLVNCEGLSTIIAKAFEVSMM